MISNREIRRLFGIYSELLLLHNDDEQLSAWLAGAAFSLRRIDENVVGLTKKELSKYFRPGIVKIVDELTRTGTIEALDELIQLTPPGLFEMMRIKGLGGKKLAILWHRAKIDTIEDLLKACKKNLLSTIPGFGEKTEKNIIKAIENLNDNKDRYHYASVAEDAEKLVTAFQKAYHTKMVSLCGEVRRQNTTVPGIELIAVKSSKKTDLVPLKKLMIVQTNTKDQLVGHTLAEVPVTVYHTSQGKFYEELFRRTGNDDHTKHVISLIRGKNQFDSEEAIYKKAKLPFILPEMRENNAEWEFKNSTEDLISTEDIRGVVHNHTTYSDGVDKLKDFVQACINKGYEYTVISDHSKNAHYAGGLKEEKVLRQFKEIDELNKQVKPFRIFKSIECDILVSGELDYDNSFLKNFDMVIVSIHQLLKMDEEKATRRLLKAIENPFTTILGHMTGRQLLIRSGYPVDFKKIIDACAANKVVIEINANPYRLDMDWSQLPYALKKKVMISINPDAHSIREIDNIRWGVSAARKGGLTKDMTWNAMPLAGIEKWLSNKKKKNSKAT